MQERCVDSNWARSGAGGGFSTLSLDIGVLATQASCCPDSLPTRLAVLCPVLAAFTSAWDSQKWERPPSPLKLLLTLSGAVTLSCSLGPSRQWGRLCLPAV